MMGLSRVPLAMPTVTPVPTQVDYCSSDREKQARSLTLYNIGRAGWMVDGGEGVSPTMPAGAPVLNHVNCPGTD